MNIGGTGYTGPATVVMTRFDMHNDEPEAAIEKRDVQERGRKGSRFIA